MLYAGKVSLFCSPDNTANVEEEFTGSTHLVASLSRSECEELLGGRLVLEHPAEHLESTLGSITFSDKSVKIGTDNSNECHYDILSCTNPLFSPPSGFCPYQMGWQIGIFTSDEGVPCEPESHGVTAAQLEPVGVLKELNAIVQPERVKQLGLKTQFPPDWQFQLNKSADFFWRIESVMFLSLVFGCPTDIATVDFDFSLK